MIKDIIKLIDSHCENIEVKGINYQYLQITKFEDIEFSYGFCNDGWLIIDRGSIHIITSEDTNYLIFIKLFELSSSEVINKIEKGILDILGEKGDIFDFFPIYEITHTAFKMESSYWCNLNLDFLLNENLFNTNLVDLLKENINKKWIHQKLQHKIKHYISKVGKK